MLYNKIQYICEIGHLMPQKPPQARQPDRALLLIMPMFPTLSLTALTTVFRLLNRESGFPVLQWTVASPHSTQTVASDGLVVESQPYTEVDDQYQFVFVLAAYRPLDHASPELDRWLARQARRGAYLVGVESGSYLLANARLLNRHAVALHHEDQGTFREMWPEQPVFNGIYNLDERMATVAGAAATLDFALALVEQRYGQLVTQQVEQIILLEHRDALARRSEPQRQSASYQQILQPCRKLMLDNLESPLPISTICDTLSIHERTLRRLFNTALGVSPTKYYLALRLTEARFMLVSTNLKVSQVGLACGFENASAFARAFRAHFGFPPSHQRSPYTGLLPTPFWPG